MPCGPLEGLKYWFSRLNCTSPRKRAPSQQIANRNNRKDDEVPTFECFSLGDSQGSKFRERNELNYIDDQSSTLPVSIVQLNVSRKSSYPKSQFELPKRPRIADSSLQTEQDFLKAFAEAQKYKDACAGAEEAAEEEVRRRFKDYQDMYYLEKAIQDKAVEAHRKLERLRRRAQEAGFAHLAPPSLKEYGGVMERQSSQDTINRFIHRLEERELDLLYAARTNNRSGSHLNEEIKTPSPELAE